RLPIFPWRSSPFAFLLSKPVLFPFAQLQVLHKFKQRKRNKQNGYYSFFSYSTLFLGATGRSLSPLWSRLREPPDSNATRFSNTAFAIFNTLSTSSNTPSAPQTLSTL